MKPTANNLIPNDWQEWLMQQGGDADDKAWGIGDFAARYADELTYADENGKRWIKYDGEKYPIQILWGAMGYWCGKSGHTIRGWERYSRLIPKDVRELYPDFYRTHHKLVNDFVKGNIEEHRRIMDELRLGADDYQGAPISVDALRNWIKEKKEIPPWWRRAVGRIIKLALKLARSEEAPADVRRYSEEYANKIGGHDG